MEQRADPAGVRHGHQRIRLYHRGGEGLLVHSLTWTIVHPSFIHAAANGAGSNTSVLAANAMRWAANAQPSLEQAHHCCLAWLACAAACLRVLGVLQEGEPFPPAPQRHARPPPAPPCPCLSCRRTLPTPLVRPTTTAAPRRAPTCSPTPVSVVLVLTLLRPPRQGRRAPPRAAPRHQRRCRRLLDTML